MDMRTNKRRNVLTHAQVEFSQSETSSLLREMGLILGTTGGGGANRKDPNIILNECKNRINNNFKKIYNLPPPPFL